VAVLGDVQQQGLKSAGLWRVWRRGAQGLGAAGGACACRGVGCFFLVCALACAGSVPVMACVVFSWSVPLRARGQCQ
jgi:hypothetical protein